MDYSFPNENYQNNYIIPYTQKYEQLKTVKKNATVYDLFTKKFQKPNNLDTLVYFMDPDINKGSDVNKNAIKPVVLLAGSNPINIVLITKTKLNSSALSSEIKNLNYRHFLFSELMYNFTKHIFSPIYYILTDQEKIDFLRINAIDNPEKIPKIKTDDIACRYYNAKYGQIFRITRETLYYESITSKSMSYRIVSD